MASPDPSPFDDPQLKAAVRRVYAGQAAPAHLRARVLAGMSAAAAGGGASAGKAASWFARPAVRWGLAAAAALAVALTVSAAVLVRERARQARIAAATHQVMQAMVAAHDQWEVSPSPAGGPPPGADNPDQALRRLGFHSCQPVATEPLTRDGWAFEGADTRYIAGYQAAHLRFARDGQRLSVFSLPIGALPGAATEAGYRETVQGHPVTGFVRGGAAHLLVASPPQGLQETAGLCERLGHAPR